MRSLVFFSTLFYLGIGCTVDNPIHETKSLCDAVATKDDMSTRMIIDELCLGYLPDATTQDALGHEKNLADLIQSINTNYPCAVASLVCYACIETNPAISEIRIDVEIDSSNYFVVIDLFTPDDDVISFSNMH